MKTCESCRYFNDQRERCYVNPPQFFSAYVPENEFEEEHSVYGWERPPVSGTDLACSNHKVRK